MTLSQWLFGGTYSDLLKKDSEDLTFEDLKAIETERRRLINKVKEPHLLDFLFAFSGTIFPGALFSWETWLCVLLYAIIRALMENKYLNVNNLPAVDLRLTQTIAAFLSFLMVFYTNQAYTRYVDQYFSCSMAITARISNITLLARKSIPLPAAWRLVRYLNAIHLLSYVGLSDTYSEENLFYPLNSSLKLLTEEEMLRINAVGIDIGGQTACREVLGWCIELLYNTYNNPSKDAENFIPMDIMTFKTILRELLELRGHIARLFQYQDQPVPFIYVHLIFFLQIFYLPLFSYTIAVFLPVTNQSYIDIVGSVLVVLNTGFFIGLSDIGKFLMDPYGDDLHDLSVMQYITTTMMGCRKLMICGIPRATSLAEEEALERQRPAVGKGFEYGGMESISIQTVYGSNNSSNNHRNDNSFAKGIGTIYAEVTSADHYNNQDNRKIMGEIKSNSRRLPSKPKVRDQTVFHFSPKKKTEDDDNFDGVDSDVELVSSNTTI